MVPAIHDVSAAPAEKSGKLNEKHISRTVEPRAADSRIDTPPPIPHKTDHDTVEKQIQLPLPDEGGELD
jgi:hypothetical protein